MDLIEAMRTTHACRNYKPDPVPDALLLKVLDGARWAPSGSNKQPVTFLVVKDADKRRKLHDLYQPVWDGIMQKYQSGEIRAGFRPGFMERVDYFAKHLAEVPVMGQEMQHYERWGLSILRSKCLRDGGRSE